MPGRPKKRNLCANFKGKNIPANIVETVPLSAIVPWSVGFTADISDGTIKVDQIINSKVSLYHGDITKLEVNAIVNAATNSLLGGGGVDGAIHKAAGSELKDNCQKLPTTSRNVRCQTGECIVTKGYNLPAKLIFHTVAPRDQDSSKLNECYKSCLDQISPNDVKSIAFCCLGTGIYSFDKLKAAEIALNSVRVWLEKNFENVERIIFCTFSTEDFDIYKDLMSKKYFPVQNTSCAKIIIESESSDMEIDFDKTPIPITDVRRENVPIGLKNEGVNVCFFNSLVQILYSLVDFRTEIHNMPMPMNQCVQGMNNLFIEMSTQISNEPIQTSKYVRNIGLDNYTFKDQYDAHECLKKIIDECYPSTEDGCLFQFDVRESLICEDSPGYSGCGQISEHPAIQRDLILHPFRTHELQSIQQLVNRYNDPRGTAVSDRRCSSCGVEGSSTRAYSIQSIPNILIIQLAVFDVDLRTLRTTKLHPNLYINDEIELFNTFSLQGIIYHQGETANTGHYTCKVKRGDKWFNINDSNINYENSSFLEPYILVYRRKDVVGNNSVRSVNSNEHSEILVTSVSDGDESELTITQPLKSSDFSAEKKNIDMLLKEVNRQKIKDHDIDQSRKEAESKQIRKRKGTLTKATSQQRMKKMRQKLDESQKEMHRENAKKGMHEMRQKLDESQKDAARLLNKSQKNESRQKLDESQKDAARLLNKNQKKESRQTLDESQKDAARLLNKNQKKESRQKLDESQKDAARLLNKNQKKESRQKLDESQKDAARLLNKNQKKESRQKLNDSEKEVLRETAKKGMKVSRGKNTAERESAFAAVKDRSMVDPSIFDTDAYKILYNSYNEAINEGPTYICDVCNEFVYRISCLHFNPEKYDPDIVQKCQRGVSEFICKSCDSKMKKNKMPPKSFNNNLAPCPRIKELDDLCTLELMLIAQIIPFMFIVSKHKGAQHGLKGQTVLVPTDLEKIRRITTLPRPCNDDHIISLALKRRLSDQSYVNKQNIRPALVNKALDKLVEINPLYRGIQVDDSWRSLSEKSDPKLWDLLTNPNAKPGDECETDSDDELLNGNGNANGPSRPSLVPFPSVLQNIDGPNVSSENMVNIAPGEGQIPVSFTSEEDWEPLAFPREFSIGKGHFSDDREYKITPSKYVHLRLKSADDRWASNPQYIFTVLDWLERNALWSSIHFSERKHFQGDIRAGQVNSNNFRTMMSDDQIFASFKNVRGTPQYWHNLKLDVLAKVRQFGCPTFFGTLTPGEFHWPEIIQIVARQYGTTLTQDDIKNMNWQTKVMWLKRNPVTVARQIDYVFRQVFNKVIMSGMHPIGQVLNIDSKREFQNRGPEHPHFIVHVQGAPKIDEDDDEDVVKFIDKHISCSLPDEVDYPELNNIVKTVQTHHHTFTCRKKKGIKCRFNAPWPPTEQTLIARGQEISKSEFKKAKTILDKVLLEISNRDTFNDVSLADILSTCDITSEEYYNALLCSQKKISVFYRRKPSEKNISPYNTVILSLIKSNMNLQFITGIYGLLTYLTSYLCKSERTMGELMRKASKESAGEELRQKLKKIGNVFLTKREVSTHEAIKRTLSMHMRTSNIDVLYLNTGIKKERTRILKPQNVLDAMHPDDTNVYATNLIDRYANRPDSLDNMCYADFATNYTSQPDPTKLDEDDIQNYTERLSHIEEIAQVVDPTHVITLKNGLGRMRKRVRPCIMRYHRVSKLKDSEQYYMKLLQLYMPWRDEERIKGESTYEDKFSHVEEEIKPNIMRHDPYFEKHDLDNDDLLDDHFSSSDDEDDNTSDDDELSIFNPNLLGLDDDSGTDDSYDTHHGAVMATSTENIFMPLNDFYRLCSQLNEGQQQLFNYVMKYATRCMLNERNDVPDPDPFYVFLSGGAGVGKSFLVLLITEYLKKRLRYPRQNCDTEPSVMVTASTGKAASHINGTTLHSAFSLPIREGAYYRQKLGAEKLQELTIKYQYLRVLIIDEISMIGKETFDDLNRFLRLIKNNDRLDFGGVSILVIGDFFQIPPVKQTTIFNWLSLTDAWYLFELHELEEIVRQSSDPHFAQLLNRIRENEPDPDSEDVKDIKRLMETDTSSWPEDHTKVFLTNALVNQENEKSIRRFREEGVKILNVVAKDLAVNSRTRKRCEIPDEAPLGDCGSLPKYLKICVGARVMLTINQDISDSLINGSTGTIIKINGVRNGHPRGIIYVKFDNDQAGNKLKQQRLPEPLCECVPIRAVTRKVAYRNGKTTIDGDRKNFPLVVSHAMTGHKAQGSTLDHMTMNLGDGEGNPTGRMPKGMFYTLLSRARSRDKVKIESFKPSQIRVNQAAKKEMKRMREKCRLSFKHPLNDGDNCKMSLLNIRSWNLHIPHIVTDKWFDLNSVYCFTETHTLNCNHIKQIEDYNEKWKNIHKQTDQGLAICYNSTKVQVKEELTPQTEMQILPVLLNIEGEDILLVLVYRHPNGAIIGNFIYQLSYELRHLPTDKYRTILLGDFNLDQMLDENVLAFEDFCNEFNFTQRSKYSTFRDGGILDLVFDSDRSDDVQWIPSPYSDHFVLVIDI